MMARAPPPGAEDKATTVSCKSGNIERHVPIEWQRAKVYFFLACLSTSDHHSPTLLMAPLESFFAALSVLPFERDVAAAGVPLRPSETEGATPAVGRFGKNL